MKILPQSSRVRSIVVIIAGLLVGALLWFSISRTKVDAIDRADLAANAGSTTETKHSNTTLRKAAIVTRDTSPQDPRSQLRASNVVPNESLLTFRNAEAWDRFVKQAGTYGLQVLDTIPQLNSVRVRYGNRDDLGNAIAANSADLANVEANLWLSIPPTPPEPDPNNEGGRAPFGYNVMNAIDAGGDRSHWGDHVTVAVLDTGILAHPTFAEGQVTHLDLVNDGQTFNSHGTSVASLIGGQYSQAPGVAPAVQILDVRVANADGYSASATLAQGIITAVDRGAQVINISLGGYGDSPILGQAVNYAFQHGTVVVAAAGNDAYGQLAIPAAYNGVISVGSVDANGRQAYFSNAGAGLDIAAPGVGVVTAWDTNKIAFVSGTSQSSALVAGAAASYLGWGVSPNQMTARLRADAQPAPLATSGANPVGILMIRRPSGRP